jgi:hypothetical protein
MRKSVEVGTEICVYDFSMASVDQLMDRSYGVQCAAVFPIGVLFRLQIGFEYGFEYQDCCHLRCPVADSGDSQSKLHMNAMSSWAGLRSSILSTHFAAKASRY